MPFSVPHELHVHLSIISTPHLLRLSFFRWKSNTTTSSSNPSYPPPPPPRKLQPPLQPPVQIIIKMWIPSNSSSHQIPASSSGFFYSSSLEQSPYGQIMKPPKATITIINDAGNSSPGKLFSLFCVSNDKATRIVLSTSQFVENFLYPDDHHSQSHPKKQVNQVILRLATQNLSTKFSVESRKKHEYVLNLSPSIMDEPNFNHAILSAVQRGMSRIWLWDGQGNAPRGLVNGMIEYISTLAGFAPELNSGHHGKLPEYHDIDSYWKGKLDPRGVAQFLDYCEKQKVGFIRRLNQAMKNDWHNSLGSNCIIEEN